MFLTLNHQKLEIFTISQELVIKCYQITTSFPPEEKFSMVSQIRRAALSVYLNIAEGASRKSLNERKRFYEIARGSIVEIDAALDIANHLCYLNNVNANEVGNLIVRSFKILTSLIKNNVT